MMTNTDSNIPILKWAGGKRWFVNRYNPLFPQKYSTYLEPFFGGGAVFFHLLPNRAILSDVNKELMNLYIAVKDYPEELNKLIKIHDTNHSKDYYYKIRERKYDSNTKKAAQLLYLNRTCWNGLYRVNLSGKFNVPIGTKSTVKNAFG